LDIQNYNAAAGWFRWLRQVSGLKVKIRISQINLRNPRQLDCARNFASNIHSATLRVTGGRSGKSFSP
jgi:hypothetical protein